MQPIWAEIEGDGVTWGLSRDPGESAESFKDRISSRAQQRHGGISMVQFKYADERVAEGRLP